MEYYAIVTAVHLMGLLFAPDVVSVQVGLITRLNSSAFIKFYNRWSIQRWLLFALGLVLSTAIPTLIPVGFLLLAACFSPLAILYITDFFGLLRLADKLNRRGDGG